MLYFEKYILAIIGAVITNFLVPIACAFSILQIWFTQLSRKLTHLLWRFVAFAIALFMVIPISVWIVDSIEATYRDSIESTINAAIQVEQAIEETNANNDEKTLWQSIIDIISNAWDGVSNLLDAAKTILSRYIEERHQTRHIMRHTDYCFGCCHLDGKSSSWDQYYKYQCR